MRDVKEIEHEMDMHFKNGDYDARNALVPEWRAAFLALENTFVEGEEVEYLSNRGWEREQIVKIVNNLEIHLTKGIVPLSLIKKKVERHKQMELL